MALQIWLPLDGNVRNNGLLGDIGINTAPSYEHDSERGNVFSTGRLYISKEQAEILLKPNEFSLACWYKPISSSGVCTLFGDATIDASEDNRYFATYIYDNPLSFHWSWYNIDGTATTGAKYIFTLNEWAHVVITYKDSIVSLYKNGSLIDTWTFTVKPRTTFFIRTLLVVTNAFARFSDYRIYNHCLSALEVSELSKGLYYHYPLNQPERSKNLVIGADKYTFSNPLTHTGENKDDFVYYNNNYIVPNVTNKTITVSVCCDGNIAPTHVDVDHNPKSKQFTFWVIPYDKNKTQINNICLNGTEYDHKKIGNYLHRWDLNMDSNTSYLQIRTNLYSNGTDSYTVKFWNIKVEEGVNNNPQWTPNEDTWDNIEYDTSGNVNNIHVLDELLPTYASDTPKYNICYNFTDAGQIINTTNHIKPTRNVSISAWVKATSIESVTEPSVDIDGINIYVNNAGVIHLVGTFGDLNSSVSCINTWCYVVGTYDGTTVKLYVNGELKASKAYTSDLQYIKGAAVSSDSKSGISCKVSDFRVYTTALTQDRIKDMYGTGAYVSNTGVLATYELNE